MITAYLFHAGGHEDPVRLRANESKSFQGSIVLGMGFTFDDTDTKGVATPLAAMRRLIENDSPNGEVIFPYIGGEEVNTSPAHAHHRYVINFGERSEEECRRRWPDLMAIVEEKVKPGRVDARGARRERWWQHAEKSIGLYDSIAGCDRVLGINCGATPHMAFAFLPSRMVFANTLAIVSFETYATLAILQSCVHELWARFFGSSLEDRLRYTPSDCFETFPFPEKWEGCGSLEDVGQAYSEFRAELMVSNNQGLTATYNRFHDPSESDPEIGRLRELHAEMDRAVLDAYGWTDLHPTCEFILDYEQEDDEGSSKKKPWRYRWPDPVRDEILARLLALNAKRAEQERLSGAAVATTKAVNAKPTQRVKRRDTKAQIGKGLFEAS